MASQQTLPLTVSYDGSTVEAAVAAGNSDYANSDITSAHFPTTRQGTEQLEAVLVHFDRYISSEQALAELNKMGLRAGELTELLAFGATYPDQQRQFLVVALGSTWLRPSGYRFVPCLDYWGVRRGLRLYWFGAGWREGCRLLAFRK